MLHSPDPERIWLGDEAYMRLNRLIDEGNYSKVFFLTDTNTHDHCLPVLRASLDDLPETEVLEVAPGENSKTPEVLIQLWYALSELDTDRHALMVNLGGGMITDLGGFLAGTYLRGLRFVNIPTSLLAMVDASTGGKNGINLDSLKNRVGLFLEPEAVGILPEFLETLPVRERRSGFAEMLKHGLIRDAGYWHQCCHLDIEEKLPELELITRSIAIKKEVVDQDYREGGLRKILNFGHTVGHALESESMGRDFPLLHGEAIALGMIAELQLSVQYTGLPQKEADMAVSALRGFYPELKPEADVEKLISIIRGDKKNVRQQLRFSLLRNIGDAVPDVPVSEEKLRQVLKEVYQ